MDPVARTQLKARIEQEVETMLTEGDRAYLQELSRSAFLEAVETELRFLGLYAHGDHETPAVIQEILETYLDQWCEAYLWQNEVSTSEAKVEIAESSLIQVISSVGAGKPIGKATRHVGFVLPLERPVIHGQLSNAAD